VRSTQSAEIYLLGSLMSRVALVVDDDPSVLELLAEMFRLLSGGCWPKR
jgi:hypothetical protein